MSDILIRKTGRAGRITLNRLDALNALTYPMIQDIDEALGDWRGDDDVALVVIDAAGDKAFSAGGDIADMYRTGTSGDFAYGRRFWSDEYKLNAEIAEYPKPYVAFMQGFTMGGGVGVSCHGSHRVVGASSRIAMPECGIGLVPDVGGSLILARAPGRLGEYLGTTGTRMGPGDAIHAGFADYYLPEAHWAGVKEELIETGDWEAVDRAALPAPDSPLAAEQEDVDRHFAGERLGDILRSLRADAGPFAAAALERMGRNAPLSMACAVEMMHRLRGPSEGRAAIGRALGLEYRFTYRAMEHADFLEGIRAAIIDKDRTPRWRHGLDGVDPAEVSRMLRPLGENALTFDEGEQP